MGCPAGVPRPKPWPGRVLARRLVQELRGDYVEMVLILGDGHDILRPHVPRLVPAKRSPIRTTSSVRTGGELRCLPNSLPRAAHIRELPLI